MTETPGAPDPMGAEVVRAAGGVPVRVAADGLEVLVVHRARYDDWTFPKGKNEPGESDEACALREVEEETGLRCALREELPSTSYVDPHGRPKVVRYWVLDVVGGELAFEHEVGDGRWLGVEAAVALLSYPRDGELLRGAVAAVAARRSAAGA